MHLAQLEAWLFYCKDIGVCVVCKHSVPVGLRIYLINFSIGFKLLMCSSRHDHVKFQLHIHQVRIAFSLVCSAKLVPFSLFE